MTKYCGWVKITRVVEGAFITTEEFKQWNSFLDLVSTIDFENVREFRIGAVRDYEESD